MTVQSHLAFRSGNGHKKLKRRSTWNNWWGSGDGVFPLDGTPTNGHTQSLKLVWQVERSDECEFAQWLQVEVCNIFTWHLLSALSSCWWMPGLCSCGNSRTGRAGWSQRLCRGLAGLGCHPDGLGLECPARLRRDQHLPTLKITSESVRASQPFASDNC